MMHSYGIVFSFKQVTFAQRGITAFRDPVNLSPVGTELT